MHQVRRHTPIQRGKGSSWDKRASEWGRSNCDRLCDHSYRAFLTIGLSCTGLECSGFAVDTSVQARASGVTSCETDFARTLPCLVLVVTTFTFVTRGRTIVGLKCSDFTVDANVQAGASSVASYFALITRALPSLILEVATTALVTRRTLRRCSIFTLLFVCVCVYVF